MNNVVVKLIFVGLVALSLAMPVNAYQVQPMMVEIPSQGKQSMITYRLQNPGDAPLPVEVEVFKRTFDENQQEILVPAESDFIVLPPQIEVPANGYQVFRAKYLGKPNLAQTSSYRIIFKQLPLTDEQRSTGVKMMFNFATLVFVNPPSVEAIVDSQLQCPEIDDCKVTITNKGKKVMDLSRYNYKVDTKDQSKLVPWPQFQSITKARFIMPEHQSVLDLKPLMQQLAAPIVEDPANQQDKAPQSQVLDKVKQFSMIDLFVGNGN